MNVVDVNVLIYAHREDQQHHPFYREKVEALLGSGAPFGLTPLVASGFIRIVTQKTFPQGPTPLSTALAVIEGIMERPNAHWLLPGQKHWTLFSSLIRSQLCRGKMVADAQHAAIAIEHAATWISRDTDFLRFESQGLRFVHWAPEDV
jgi:toxin-antitoxin system PIN domain toxin